MADLAELRQAHEDLYASYEGLVADIEGDDWDRGTGCPGWSVRDVVAHVVGLEGVLAGVPEPEHELPADLPHVQNEFGRYMETHVDVRRRGDPADLVAELHDVLGRRRGDLAEIEELGQEIRSVMGGTGPAAQVLTIRVVDLWMHEQDLRRALGRPGHRRGPAADISLRRLERGVVSELPGRLEDATGVVVIEVGDTGRRIAVDLATGEAAQDPPEQAASIRMDLDDFVAFAGGARTLPRSTISTSVVTRASPGGCSRRCR